MQFFAGYFFGVVTAGLLLSAGYYLALWQYVPYEKSKEFVPRPRFFGSNGGKKTPKFITEEEQAIKESRSPIGDVDKLRERHYPGE